MVGASSNSFFSVKRISIIVLVVMLFLFGLHTITHARANQPADSDADIKLPSSSLSTEALKHLASGTIKALQKTATKTQSTQSKFISELSKDKDDKALLKNGKTDDRLQHNQATQASQNKLVDIKQIDELRQKLAVTEEDLQKKKIDVASLQDNNFSYSVASILGVKIPNAQTFPPGGFPHKVKVGFMLNDMSNVDDLTGYIQITGTVTEKWEDERLRYKPESYGSKDFIFIFAGNKARSELEKIWQPYIRVQNAATSFSIHSDLLIIQPNGIVVYQMKFYTTISTNITIQKYPFVVQNVEAIISSQLYDKNLVQLVPLPKMEGVYGVASSPGWNVDKTFTTRFVDLKREKNLKAQFSTYVFTFTVRSESASFVMEVMFPLIALSLLASLLFWISQFNHQRRIGLGLTLLMSLIAYQYLMYHAIPRTSYITFMNLLSIGSLIFIFLTLLCIILVENIETRLDLPEDEKDAAGMPIKMPRVTQILITVFKWTLPSLYLIYLLVICLVMLT